MALNNDSLLYFLTDSLQSYTEDLRIVSRSNPILIEMNGVRYSVHVSSIHDSGNSRPNEDEERIQIRRAVIDAQNWRANGGITTLFIGFFPEGQVFTAWDPEHVFAQRPERGGSVYARWSHNALARVQGVAMRRSRSKNLSRDVTTLSLRTEALGFYFENWRSLHALRTEDDAIRLTNATASVIETDVKSGSLREVIELPDERMVVTITRIAFARNPKFRDDVMRAYEGRCCICDRQLGLVQAAHIIPHAHQTSSDHISNGLALCIEHHRMYDDALLLPNADQQLYLNLDRVEHLKNIGQAEGLVQLQALSVKQYKVPNDAASRPENALLERGVRIRLGTDT